MMNVGGSMHPTKYAVRCIVHSTVLLSDISCVWKRDTKRHPTKYAVRCIVHSTVLMSDISCVWKRGTKRDISTWSLTGGG